MPTMVAQHTGTELRCRGPHPDRPGQRCGKVLLLELDIRDGRVSLVCPRCHTVNVFEKRAA